MIQYTYDWADQLKSITYPDGMVVKYNYDSRGRLTTVGGAPAADSAKYAQLAYTHRNQVESMKLGGTLQEVDYAYNERGWLQSINGGSSSSSGAPNDVFGQALYYDTLPNPPSGWSPQYNGNLFGQKVSMVGQDTTFAYRYDESDRLKEVKRDGNPFEVFTYDANGNFLSRTKGSSTASYTYTAGTNKISQVSNPTPFTLSYDPNGNVTRHSGKGASADYDVYNQMRRMWIDGSVGEDTISYGYNAAGERVYKAYLYHYRVRCEPNSNTSKGFLNTTTPNPVQYCTYTAIAHTYYILGQGRVLAEQSGVSPSTARFKFIYAGGNRIAMRDASQKLHFYLNDHLGSARVVIDSTGLVKDKYWYYAFGESRNEQVSTNQSYRYTSKPLDKEGGINIYYYGARYYDPELGRFWAVDPAAGKYPGWSPYAYAKCNPVSNIDPDGRYAADFHYDFMYFAAVKVMGASPEVARAIATANLNVDVNWKTDSFNPMNWGENSLHFQSAASDEAISSLGDPGSLTNEKFGAAMHTYQDVGFAHQGFQAFGGKGFIGHASEGGEPDRVGQESDRGQAKSSTIDAIKGTYGILVARNGGKANITYENFLNLCLEYLKQNGGEGFKDIQKLVGGKTREEIEMERERRRQEVSGPLWKWGEDRNAE